MREFSGGREPAVHAHPLVLMVGRSCGKGQVMHERRKSDDFVVRAGLAVLLVSRPVEN